MSRKKRPRRRSMTLRTTTTVLIPNFRPVAVARRISRAGLNGIAAIERGRRASRSAARRGRKRPRRKR